MRERSPNLHPGKVLLEEHLEPRGRGARAAPGPELRRVLNRYLEG